MSAPAQTYAHHRRRLPDAAVLSDWRAPDGWSLRRFDWPSSVGRGRLLFQGGRGDVIEKYLETFAHFHARGWSVTSFDWRGQGGSGRLSPDPHVGHASSFTPYVADLAALWREGDGEGGPRVAIGHSMGGHLLLRAMVDGSVAPDAAVLVAPMLGLRSPLGARLGGRIARFVAGRGDPARAAWRGNERPASLVSRQRLLTGDGDRYADEGWWYERTPSIRLGPPSWAWLAEAFRSTAALEADPRLDALAVPVLTLVADRDGLVDARAALRVAARLPRGELMRFGPESAHEILREVDPIRDRALAAIDAFLDRHAPA
ncbi:alpha/beta fold hydrolase [uncultured Sphingomonas sp.]|uniref:alpha/beta fold hydrolase n=1 Tax=uncultured Sphingomonas sp. TaxID=158754 RepID=UPI0035CBEEBE